MSQVLDNLITKYQELELCLPDIRKAVELQREAIPRSLSVCRILPAGLSEQVGDYASLSVVLYTLHEEASATMSFAVNCASLRINKLNY